VLFEETIGMRKSTEENQRELLRQNMIARGIDPDAIPDVELKPEWFKDNDDGFAGWEDADIKIEM
jgi:hypothetical protein